MTNFKVVNSGDKCLLIGYTRISRDEDRKNYATIIAQKKIIANHAKEVFGKDIPEKNLYEDDNYSGYSFNRPDFNRMLEDINFAIENGYQVVLLVKDISRIGRHNAYTLLFLEDMKRLGVRVILISDSYDSFVDDDSILGIKTWYNERYVKDISTKIKDNNKTKMIDGKYLSAVPYGYKRDPLDREKVIIDEETAWVVKKIFEMYLQGDGYRKICIYLTENEVPTPSMVIQRNKEAEGKVYKKDVTHVWVQRMVQRIVRNDFYIGVLRQGKYKLAEINGKILRVNPSQHYVFANNHEPLVSVEDFELAQEIAEKRLTMHYRGSGHKHVNLFTGFLVCADCGRGFVALNKEGKHKSYICGTYRRVGKIACTTHYILDRTLLLAIKAHLVVLREKLSDAISGFDGKLKDQVKRTDNLDKSLQRLNSSLKQLSDELKVTMKQRINEVARRPEDEEIISEAYAEIEAEKRLLIKDIQRQIDDLTEIKKQSSRFQEGSVTALSVLDELIGKEMFDRKDLSLLVDKIIVNEDGEPTIYLKANIEKLLQYEGGDHDPDGNGGGYKATVTYKAGAVIKTLVSTLASNFYGGELVNDTVGLKEPSCTTRLEPMRFRDWARRLSPALRVVILMLSACLCLCLARCWKPSG